MCSPLPRYFVSSTRLIIPLLLGLLLLPLSVGGWGSEVDWRGDELTGEVLDTDGRPVSAASVQLLAQGRVVASTPTGQDGRFSVMVPVRWQGRLADHALALRVERMGYDPLEWTVSGAGDQGTVTLIPRPIPLPGFQVEGERPTCEGDDEEGLGRVLWEVARAKHPGGLDTLGVATYTRVQVDTLRMNSGLGEDGEGGILAPGQRGSSPLLRLGWERRIDREGYAFPVRRTDRFGSFSSWSYAPLDADLAPHFGLESFGDNHYFQLLPQASGEEVALVRFCGRHQEHPHLDGRLEIGADTLIRAVEWRFLTPEPQEEAGGRAVFPPGDLAGEAPVLLPMESEVWVTQRDTRTIRRAQWFEEWVLAPGDSVPFLPRRAGEGGAPPN